MALTTKIKLILLGKELIFENAYIRVEELYGSKEEITIKVDKYSGDLATKIQTSYYKFKPITTDESLNYHRQSYEYLKTLDEYTDAVDC